MTLQYRTDTGALIYGSDDSLLTNCCCGYDALADSYTITGSGFVHASPACGPDLSTGWDGAWTVNSCGDGSCAWRYPECGDVVPRLTLTWDGTKWEIIGESRYFDGANWINCLVYLDKDSGGTNQCDPSGSYTVYDGSNCCSYAAGVPATMVVS